MEKIRNVVIVGEAEIGKTTLANALLGWDIFPQSTWDLYIPTEEPSSRMLSENIQLTDTPGYDLRQYQVPESVNKAISGADTIIMVFTGFGDARDVDWEHTEPEEAEEFRRWLEALAREEKMQKELLSKAKTGDIYFVLPFYEADGPLEQSELDRDLKYAKERFASFSDYGEAAFFCIDPMMALVAAIEDDREALEKSGILPLKDSLLAEKRHPCDSQPEA